MLRNKTGKTLSLNINEIYKSIQGEGFLVGSPCIFIRIQGCNLRCSWCDQPSSLSFIKRNMKLEDILEEVEIYKCNHIVITGGEPFTEPNLHLLVHSLLDRGYFIQIETNGTLWNKHIGPVGNQIYISCSPKRETGFYVNENILILTKEIKFVVDEFFKEEILFKKLFIRFLKEGKVILQPESNKKEMFMKAVNIQNNLLARGYSVRIIPQIHKIFGIP